MLQEPLLGNFYEWTNSVFERLVSGEQFYKKKDAMQLSSSGYEALGPLGSMVSCALGMPESKFAEIKDKGKDYEIALLENMFPIVETKEGKVSRTSNGIGILEKIYFIFNQYNLDTSFSLSKKRSNQDLLNELYAECIKIMRRRIENEVQNKDMQDLEEYRKYQRFYLRKMNANFKSASNSDGFKFLRTPIIHDIGFCDDNISRTDLAQIAQQHIALTEYRI